MNAQLFEITREEKHSEIKREIQMREKVYGTRVKEGRLSAASAARRIEIMRAILKDYEVAS